MTIIHSFFIDLYILNDSWDCGSLPHKNVNIQPYMFFLFPYFSIKIIQFRTGWFWFRLLKLKKMNETEAVNK